MKQNIYVDIIHEAFLLLDLYTLRKRIREVLRYYLGNNRIIQIEIFLLHNIHKYNQQYRQCDGDTDIISIQMSNMNSSGPIILGSIFLSENIINIKSIQYSKNYIWYIMVHGLLHLCNFHHNDDQAFSIMRIEENMWMQKWNIDVAEIDKIYYT